MTRDEAVALVSGWPKDRTVPKRLAAAISGASGELAFELSMLVEVLLSASETEADYELIAKYFPD